MRVQVPPPAPPLFGGCQTNFDGEPNTDTGPVTGLGKRHRSRVSHATIHASSTCPIRQNQVRGSARCSKGDAASEGRRGRLCFRASCRFHGFARASIGHVVRTMKMPLRDALAMATANPGRCARGRGQLVTGSRADLVRFRYVDEIFIEGVWLAGERVYGSGD